MKQEFNRYDVEKVAETKSELTSLMLIFSMHATKSSMKNVTRDTPNNRRGKSTIRTMQHYFIDDTIETYEERVSKPKTPHTKAWQKTLRKLKKIKQNLDAHQSKAD